MKILYLVDSFPFPPRQGVELPNSHLIEAMSKRHDVSLMVLNGHKEIERIAAVPVKVKSVFCVKAHRRPRIKAMLSEVFLLGPAFEWTTFDLEQVQNIFRDTTYDLLWCSTLSAAGFITFCSRHKLLRAKKVALGVNDVTTTFYWDSFLELLSGRYGFDFVRLVRGLRVPFIAINERRIFSNVDLVHVQTEQERKFFIQLMGQNYSAHVSVSSNGVNQELSSVEYQSKPCRKILFMTSLFGVRRLESKWFLEKVWPLIYQQQPSLSLILVGQQADQYINLPIGVESLGFVPTLEAAYQNVCIAVLPILHGTGIINRAVDAFRAGVPLVTTPRVLRTIDGAQSGTHALTALTADEFANKVLLLVGNAQLRAQLSSAAIALVKTMNTWEQFSNIILSDIDHVSGEGI